MSRKKGSSTDDDIIQDTGDESGGSPPDSEYAPPPDQPPPEPGAEPQEPAAPPPPTLTPEAALQLFQTGHRIAKQGDPPEHWISQGRTGDGSMVLQMPLTQEMLDEIKNGEFYIVDDQGISRPRG
jgi:hypothetical protein